ncbi:MULTISPECIES: TonB-dependent receptor [Acidobacteriaceae]|uniref:TonB-dependent receptor n=1 Tax=Acidobacteriaceae TaxID=204434 RepID=UPI00131A6EB4|nr:MULTISPECIES: TonB-dependent receptor [Acidobacteriaceae]MDW5265594.1 TonB-dependent receptor [Edaphobacter sp.]
MHRPSLRPSGILKPFFTLLFLIAALPLLAQSGQLSGVVKDPTQLVVPNAQITLTDTQSSITASATTNQQGVYLFTGVAAGTYRLTAQAQGFNSIVIPQMAIEAGQSATQDLTFHLGTATETINVSATAPGSAESGYRVDNVAPGVLGTAPIVNTPYVISVLSNTLIANTQTKSLRDAIKYLPLVSFQEQQGSDVIRPETRGIEGSNMQNTRMDGMGIAITSANPMEQYQQLEVVNGLGASMYGPANPSGMFNFILKRPTEERFTNLSLDYDNKSIGTIYADTGGRLGPHKIFGYRGNLLYGDGTSYVEASRLRRRLAEFAFDVRPTNATLIDAHYSAYDVVQRGYPGWFTYGPDPKDKTNHPPHTLILPAAPDPTRVGYGQAYAGVNLTTQTTSGRLHHDFSPNWHALAGVSWQRLDRFIDTPVNNLTDNNGDYSSSLANGFAPRFGVNSDLGYITGTVKALGMTHDLVIGSTGYEFTSYSGTKPSAASVLLGTANINAPRVFAAPAALPRNINLYHSSIVNQQGFNLGDFITLPAHFLVRLAASQDWIGVDNYSSATVRSGGSNKNGVSPSVSLLYKPLDNMTIYGTYASSLQQGDTAPAGAVNANQALPPYRSKEWEVGYKAQVHTIALTTALFRIERPFANTDASNVFRITGDQVNYGAEISAQGTLFHRLLLDGGFTALNPRLNDTGVTATNGKLFVGTPPYKSNILSEYQLPFLEGLTVTGDWQYIGRRPQDDENLHFTNGYNTFDFGLRYSHRVLSKQTTWRVASNNITNTRYYSTLGPGDITGTNASSNTAHLGEPRTVAASMQIAF